MHGVHGSMPLQPAVSLDRCLSFFRHTGISSIPLARSVKSTSTVLSTPQVSATSQDIAYRADIDPHEPCMYGWLSKSFGRTVCTPYEMWLNHAEIRCIQQRSKLLT